MSRPRFTFFKERSQEQPDRSRSDRSSAGDNQPATRFRLQQKTKRQSQLEWQFGREDNELFQLRTIANAPTEGLIVGRSATTRRPQPTDRRPEIDQWRRPTTPAPVSSAPRSPSRALEGEIVHSTPTPLSGVSSTNASPWASPGRNGHVAATGQRRPAATRSNLVATFEGEEGMRRLLATRLALDEALDRWWTNSEHAPLTLLRDGLLALEAGHDLDETQRSFLLRTALRAERGMVTALRYQLDADRTAFLFKEALLDTKHPLNPMLITDLRQEDEQSAEWADYLEHDLAYEATVATGKRSHLAATARNVMNAPSPVPQSADLQIQSGVPVAALRRPSALWAGISRPMRQARQPVRQPEPLLPLSHRWSLRWLVWTALMLLLLLTYGQPQLVSSAKMVEIPAGSYVVSDPASSNPIKSGRYRTVTLAAYAIDRQEVINGAYRRCWEQNACPIPSSFDSQSRPGYFSNRSFDNFPVVNVNWAAANTYCAWVGRRLPTLEEWEVAASLAPATGLRYSYPWGDRFESRVVNSAASNLNDTQSVGTYHPTGSTPTGIMDLAGNVAEWTSMPAASMVDGGVVKGGSFRDQPIQLRNDALIEVPRSTSASWLGFRCAADK